MGHFQSEHLCLNTGPDMYSAYKKKPWKLSSFEKGQTYIPGERKLTYCVACIFHTETPIKMDWNEASAFQFY